MVHETLGVEEFKTTSFPNAPIYLDTTKAFYRHLGAGSLIWADPSDLTSPEAKKNGDRARAKKLKGNMKGEGRLMGGLVVVDKNGATCGSLRAARPERCMTTSLLSDAYNEKIFGDHAPLDRENSAFCHYAMC